MQGLIDVHPDVDAICRLTQPLGVSFDEHLPAVVRASPLCPGSALHRGPSLCNAMQSACGFTEHTKDITYGPEKPSPCMPLCCQHTS